MNLFWALFTVIPLVTFGVAETVGSRSRGGTFTAAIRRWLGIDPPAPRRRWTVGAFVGVLLAFDAWFLPHIIFGIWPS